MYQLIYVLHEIFSNDGPVIITTKKLNVQLLAYISDMKLIIKKFVPTIKPRRTVDRALAGPRIRNPTISAGFADKIRWVSS